MVNTIPFALTVSTNIITFTLIRRNLQFHLHNDIFCNTLTALFLNICTFNIKIPYRLKHRAKLTERSE